MSSGTYQPQETKSASSIDNRSQQSAPAASVFQLKDNRPEATAQLKLQESIGDSTQVKQLKAYQQLADNLSHVKQLKANTTGLPDQLKSGIESLGGMSLDHVNVHYNSGKPGQLNAHAYAQGSDIHVAPGQEKHLPHEAWHVVQQAQGRVKPTMQLKAGVPVNDDAGLEKEADEMGAKALSSGPSALQRKAAGIVETSGAAVVQRVGKSIGNGIAELHVPDVATTTVSIFSHGRHADEMDPIAGLAIGYYCPHGTALNSNLSMMERATLYAAETGAPAGKWHNYALKVADVGLTEEQAKTLCNANGSALALVKIPTSTKELAALLKAEGYETIKAIHCRESDGDNLEWDPVSDRAIPAAAKAKLIVTRNSLDGKWELGDAQITDATVIEVGFVYADAADSYDTAYNVVEVKGTNLTVEKSM
jgi:hypothetical protein